MLDVIDSFRGEYDFLSNFYPCRIEWDGFCFPSVENAFQASKCAARASEFITITPAQAKHLGRRVSLDTGVEEWNKNRIGLMYQLLKIKFSDPVLREKLRSTGDVELIEGNTWRDTYWGVCNTKGQNNLGKLLMRVRSKI